MDEITATTVKALLALVNSTDLRIAELQRMAQRSRDPGTRDSAAHTAQELRKVCDLAIAHCAALRAQSAALERAATGDSTPQAARADPRAGA